MGVGGAILASIGAAIYLRLHESVTSPVQVNVEVDPSFYKDKRPNWTPYFYYLPATRSSSRRPQPIAATAALGRGEQDGADADETRMALTLTGSRPGSRGASLDPIR